MRREGGCLCGAVRYVVEGEPNETVHCHCRTCQKSAGAAFLTWSTFPKEAFAYTRGTVRIYRSSDMAQREFCPGCGTQLVFRADREPTLDVTTASFDEPDDLRPVANTWIASRRAWLHGFDSRIRDIDGEWPGAD